MFFSFSDKLLIHVLQVWHYSTHYYNIRKNEGTCEDTIVFLRFFFVVVVNKMKNRGGKMGDHRLENK